MHAGLMNLATDSATPQRMHDSGWIVTRRFVAQRVVPLRRATLGLATLGIVSLLVGCATAPPRQPLPMSAAPGFSATEGLALPIRWWESFADASLTGHIETGLSSSFTLRAAWLGGQMVYLQGVGVR